MKGDEPFYYARIISSCSWQLAVGSWQLAVGINKLNFKYQTTNSKRVIDPIT
jgi:hypothetical protein